MKIYNEHAYFFCPNAPDVWDFKFIGGCVVFEVPGHGTIHCSQRTGRETFAFTKSRPPFDLQMNQVLMQ